MPLGSIAKRPAAVQKIGICLEIRQKMVGQDVSACPDSAIDATISGSASLGAAAHVFA
jgi:hypothetical protein